MHPPLSRRGGEGGSVSKLQCLSECVCVSCVVVPSYAILLSPLIGPEITLSVPMPLIGQASRHL